MVLALQRAIGNRAVARLLQRDLTSPIGRDAAGNRPVAASEPPDSFGRNAESAASHVRGSRDLRGGSGIVSPTRVFGPQRAGARPLQRALPVAAEVLEIALTAAITVQEQAALTQGGLHYQSDKGSRHGDPPQPVDQEYRALVIFAERDHVLYPNVRALFYIHWQGNKFGEMGGAYVQLSLEESSEFHEHFGSALDVHFTVLDTMPKKGDDPRLWSMQWIYEGYFDPVGPGQYPFQGKFEIDAFGGFRVLEHVVQDYSTGWGLPSAADIVQHGRNRASAAPPPKPKKEIELEIGTVTVEPTAPPRKPKKKATPPPPN
jgi:hypothetical protein